VAEYSEEQTNDTLRYLNGLFDLKNYMIEHKASNITHPNAE
jgi:hypothetical protein